MDVHGQKWDVIHKSDSNSEGGMTEDESRKNEWHWTVLDICLHSWRILRIDSALNLIDFLVCKSWINVGYGNISVFSLNVEFVPFCIPLNRMTTLNWYSSFSRSKSVLRISLLTLSNSEVSFFFLREFPGVRHSTLGGVFCCCWYCCAFRTLISTIDEAGRESLN